MWYRLTSALASSVVSRAFFKAKEYSATPVRAGGRGEWKPIFTSFCAGRRGLGRRALAWLLLQWRLPDRATCPWKAQVVDEAVPTLGGERSRAWFSRGLPTRGA